MTGVAEGTVRIIAREGAAFSDSVTLKVVAPGAAEGGKKKAGTGRMTIVVSVSKEKIPYDGLEHGLSFSYDCDTEDFDPELVHLNSEAKVISGTDCGVYNSKYTASDFTYEDSANVEFIVSNGWLQIKPISVTVKANDAEKMEGDEDPEFTATVTGMLEGEDPDLISYTFKTVTENGVTLIRPVCDRDQGHYRVKSEDGILTVKPMIESDLYNLAMLAGTKDYYRLSKTRIKTRKPLSEYLTGVSKAGTNITLDESEYKAEPYDFENLIIEREGKKYAYITRKDETGLDVDGFYTATLNEKETVTAVKQKIGGMNGSNPRWFVPAEQRYQDKNAIDSFHRNYTITIYDMSKLEVQDVYNMLSVNGNGNYYRLPTTKIKAINVSEATTGKALNPDSYSLGRYDFTNTVLNLNGTEYKYSATELTGEYDAYFTVEFVNVMREIRFNNDAKWYNNAAGWLDGADKEYGNLPNDTVGYHANYKATTHKGTRTAVVTDSSLKVSIISDWPAGKPAYLGTKITLTGKFEGFEGKTYKIQWQYSTDGKNWKDQAGATGVTFTYELNETTAKYHWRVVARDIK